MSDLPQPSINPDGTIASAARNGCCEHYSETYRFIGGKLTLVADVAVIHRGEWETTTTRKLVNGKWRSKIRKVRQVQ